MLEPALLSRPLAADPDAFRPDPHAGFALYRPRSGLIRLGEGFPVVTRYQDVVRLMNDPATRQIETEPLTSRGINDGPLLDFYANTMLLSIPPAHARRRAPAARAFAFRVIDAWRPHIRALVEELISTTAVNGEFDFVEAIASPLPARLIAMIVGVPDEDTREFTPLVYAMARGLGAFRDADRARIEQAARDLTDYVERQISARRKAPQDDFLTEYLLKADEFGEMSPLEKLMQIVTIILAGSDTTRFALTMLVGLLLEHPEQWQAVARDPTLAPAAALEALRFEPSIGTTVRIPTEDFLVDGVRLAAGEPIALSILSAQRDEAQFHEPMRFNIFRTDQPRLSLSFGAGRHRCLGEALARAELEEALRAITSRMPGLRLVDGRANGMGHGGIRGITPMRVVLARE
jgi:hypothetical protein